MDQYDIGDTAYYSAQGIAWNVMELLGSLHFLKNLSLEEIMILIACFNLNYSRTNGINRLKSATRAEIKASVSKFGMNAGQTVEALVEQGYLVEAGRGYIVVCPELMRGLAHLSRFKVADPVGSSRIQ